MTIDYKLNRIEERIGFISGSCPPPFGLYSRLPSMLASRTERSLEKNDLQYFLITNPTCFRNQSVSEGDVRIVLRTERITKTTTIMWDFYLKMEERIGFEPTALQFCKLFPWTTRAPLPTV